MDEYGFVEVSVGGEEGTELLGGRVPIEATNVELASGGVAVGEGAHDFDDVRVAEGSRLEDVENMVRGEGLNDIKI